MKLEATRGVGTAFARAAALAVVAAGCGELGAPGAGMNSGDGAQRGELAIYVVDGKDGQSQLRYALRAPSGHEQALLFDSNVRDLDLAPGTEIKVWGTDSPDGLRVTSFRAISPSPDEVKRSALMAGTAYNARSFAFVLLDMGNGFNPAVDETLVMGRMINNADSIRNYYISDSYGRQDITTQVFGPIKYTLNGCATNGSSSGPGQLSADLRAMIPGTFQHYLWYFGSNQSACSWAGLASLGTPDKPSKDTWYNASTNCVVLVQEPGHNFGMQHSSSLACPGASLLDDPGMCTVSEYGDSFDPMGGGCRHMNAWQKAYQGWFGGCNGVTVTSSGTFTLLPLETRCDGAQFLKVKAAKSRSFVRPAGGGGMASTETLAYYYVELRTPVDFDGMLGNRSQLAPQILIHAADEIRGRAQKGLHTFLLDMTPNTAGGAKGFTDAALPLGATFTDPAGGVTITATAIGANQATITVEIEGGTGAPACLDGSTFAAPGPGPDSCGTATGPNGGGGASGTGGTSGSGGATSSGGATGAGGRTGSGGNAAGGRSGSGGSGAGGRGGFGGKGAAGSSGAAGKVGGGSGGNSSSGGQNGSGSGGATATGGSGPATGSGGATEPDGGVKGSGGASNSGGSTGTGTGGDDGAGSGGATPTTGSGGATGPGVVVGGGCSVGGGGGGSSAPGIVFGASLLGALSFRRRRRRL